jgi:dTDP-4-amino-4,6-dideoxygalactose transaminase
MPKSKVSDLAVFGAPAEFEAEVCVGRPNIGRRADLLARITDIVERKRLTNDGPFVAEFERRIAELTGVPHCVAVSNATTGLQLLARSLKLEGEVIVPSFTFVATAHALRWLGMTPVFCDVDIDTHCIDPARVRELITPRTTGVVGVHLWGRPCDVAALLEITDRSGLKLIFDAAHAFGCSSGGRMIGGGGVAEVFSFHATKVVNSFEGGAIVTRDAALAAELRLMRNHGFADYDQVECLGINGKMTEPAAAMGLTSLESMDEFVAANRSNFRSYARLLADVPGVTLMPYDERERCTFQYVVVRVDETRAGMSRDELHRVLTAERVLARRYFYPGCHRMEPYASLPTANALKNTERLTAEVLCLPTGTSVGEPEVEAICNIIRLALRNGAAVRERLRGDGS